MVAEREMKVGGASRSVPVGAVMAEESGVPKDGSALLHTNGVAEAPAFSAIFDNVRVIITAIEPWFMGRGGWIFTHAHAEGFALPIVGTQCRHQMLLPELEDCLSVCWLLEIEASAGIPPVRAMSRGKGGCLRGNVGGHARRAGGTNGGQWGREGRGCPSGSIGWPRGGSKGG